MYHKVQSKRGAKTNMKKKKSLSKLEKRCVDNASIMLKTNGTVRSVAKEVGLSKSSVYNDVAVRLKNIDKRLYNRVRKLLDKNKDERYSRGGAATKLMYMMKKQSTQ